jgi:broad specificity phosphatase PhoE
MRRLLVLRHAQTASNAAGQYVSRSDPPLDATGVDQALRVAAGMREVTADRIVSSPAERARQTAEIVVAAAGRRPPPLATDPRLAELELGPFEGAASCELLDGARGSDYRLWRSLQEEFTPDGVESLSSVAERGRSLLGEQPDSTTWLFVTHAFTSRILLADLLGLPLVRHRVLKLELGHMAVIDWFEGFPRLMQLNVVAPTVESGALRDFSL